MTYSIRLAGGEDWWDEVQGGFETEEEAWDWLEEWRGYDKKSRTPPLKGEPWSRTDDHGLLRNDYIIEKDVGTETEEEE